MNEDQLHELLAKYSDAIIDHIKGLVKERKGAVSKTSLYGMLDELKQYKSDVDDSSYSYELAQAIDAIDSNQDQLQALDSMQCLARELVNYGNHEQKVRFVDLVANSDTPEGLDYSCNYASIVHDGNNSFDL